MNSKNILTILLTAIIAGGGVYFFVKNNQPIPTPTIVQKEVDIDKIKEGIKKELMDEMKKNEKEVAQPSITKDIVEIAKASNNKFLYLVSSPSLSSTKVILKDFYGTFSFKYPWNEWRELHFTNSDLTGSSGGDTNRFDQLLAYNFCAGSLGCDMSKKEGKGFEIQIWNATYPGKTDNPNFFKNNGEILVKETEKIIITYKPYKDSYNGQGVTEAVDKLFESFELIE